MVRFQGDVDQPRHRQSGGGRVRPEPRLEQPIDLLFRQGLCGGDTGRPAQERKRVGDFSIHIVAVVDRLYPATHLFLDVDHGDSRLYLYSFFNWGHHTYIVPAAPWIKHVAYGVSMTELIILYVVIRGWIKRLPEAKKKLHLMPYRFLFASDVWIILNLVLALAISVPAINIYTHGTHITVAHSMGSMIGINSMILLASVFFIFAERLASLPKKMMTLGTWGFYILNISLVFFWGCLLAAGAIRGYMTATGEILGGQGFHMVQEAIRPYMIAFILPGLGLLIGFGLLLTPLAMVLLKRRAYSP